MVTLQTVQAKMKTEIRIFDNSLLIAAALVKEFLRMVAGAIREQSLLNIALSGGNTPRIFFDYLGTTYADGISWGHVHLFWGDERCVPPEHTESNYQMTKETLLKRIAIPFKNVHRIRGEDDPFHEAKRYSQEIKRFIPKSNSGLPVFDWILLGIGEDGHTAAIFPDSKVSEDESAVCAVATHPRSGQKRITLTLPVLNNARKITFLVSGKSKAEIVRSILQKEKDSLLLPAARIKPLHGVLEWYLDREAASLLK